METLTEPEGLDQLHIQPPTDDVSKVAVAVSDSGLQAQLLQQQAACVMDDLQKSLLQQMKDAQTQAQEQLYQHVMQSETKLTAKVEEESLQAHRQMKAVKSEHEASCHTLERQISTYVQNMQGEAVALRWSLCPCNTTS